MILPSAGVNGDGSRPISVRHDRSNFNGQLRVDSNSFNFVPRIHVAADRPAADVCVVKTTIDVVERQTCTVHSIYMWRLLAFKACNNKTYQS